MTEPGYPNPPIAEALVELRFEFGRPWKDVQDPLVEAFAKTHSGNRRKLESYQVSAAWKDGTVASQAGATFSKWLLPDPTGRRLIGIGDDVLSVHVVAPYPGWAKFRPAIDEAFREYVTIAQPRGLTQAVVRYIDQILIPEGAELEDYFTALPKALPSQPKALTSFQVTTEAIDPSTRVRSVLTMVTGPYTGEGRRVVVYDLNLTHDFPAKTPISAWGAMVELLHTRQRSIFEESITQTTRALFQ
jgi:uncharacterized protein (TIGR04255 family)